MNYSKFGSRLLCTALVIKNRDVIAVSLLRFASTQWTHHAGLKIKNKFYLCERYRTSGRRNTIGKVLIRKTFPKQNNGELFCLQAVVVTPAVTTRPVEAAEENDDEKEENELKVNEFATTCHE